MTPRVLLIDDSPMMHTLVRAELASVGWEMHGALDGVNGIRLAGECHPDLILLDVSMPGMDGFEVCEVLKVWDATAHVPVLFLSAVTDRAERVRGLDQGACDFLTKPFDGDELRARIRVSLRHKFQIDMEARRAQVDGLTGAWNRKYLDSRVAAEAATAARSHGSLAVVMLDIDRFKALNDAHGHAAGDDAIRQVSDVLARMCRREDAVCRYGGEEFVVVCPGRTALDAAALAERLRAAIERTPVTIEGAAPVTVTCSFGVAAVTGAGGDALVARADKAMYAAKQAGRNRVVIARSGETRAA